MVNRKGDLEKSSLPHVIVFEPKRVSRIGLGNLIKADDPSPFPALSQIEVYGKVMIGNCETLNSRL